MKNPTKKTKKMHARDFGKKNCIVSDYFDEGLRFLIINIKGSHFCAYIGVPSGHPIAGFDCDLISVDCHGGLTFGGEGGEKGTIYPKGYFFYGWDYAHYGDYNYSCFKDEEIREPEANKKDWTLEEVIKDSCVAIDDFKRVIKLAEGINNKAIKL